MLIEHKILAPVQTHVFPPASNVLTGMCMGSSTNHVVRFDGLALRLDGEGLCSYTLLTVSRGSSEGSEVKLHTGPCQDSANYHQVCMKAMEVIHGSYRVLLKDDMMVRYMIYVMFKKSALTVRICSFILHMFI